MPALDDPLSCFGQVQRQRDLVDRVADVLDRHDRAHRVDHPEIGDARQAGRAVPAANIRVGAQTNAGVAL